MRQALAALAVAALLSPALAGAQELKTENDKILYSMGYIIGERGGLGSLGLSKQEVELVKKGLADSAAGAKAAVDIAAFAPKIGELAKTHIEAKKKADKPKVDAQKAKGQAFAEKAAKEPGAVKLPSGLVYKELKAGTGASPGAGDTVTVHYRGTLIDGTEFDSSFKHGQPVELPLDGVIPCWTEGVQKMKAGGKARLVCPSDLAYRDQGQPPHIPGGATLVFEVELLEVKGK